MPLNENDTQGKRNLIAGWVLGSLELTSGVRPEKGKSQIALRRYLASKIAQEMAAAGEITAESIPEFIAAAADPQSDKIGERDIQILENRLISKLSDPNFTTEHGRNLSTLMKAFDNSNGLKIITALTENKPQAIDIVSQGVFDNYARSSIYDVSDQYGGGLTTKQIEPVLDDKKVNLRSTFLGPNWGGVVQEGVKPVTAYGAVGLARRFGGERALGASPALAQAGIGLVDVLTGQSAWNSADKGWARARGIIDQATANITDPTVQADRRRKLYDLVKTKYMVRRQDDIGRYDARRSPELASGSMGKRNLTYHALQDLDVIAGGINKKLFDKETTGLTESTREALSGVIGERGANNVERVFADFLGEHQAVAFNLKTLFSNPRALVTGGYWRSALGLAQKANIALDVGRDVLRNTVRNPHVVEAWEQDGTAAAIGEMWLGLHADWGDRASDKYKKIKAELTSGSGEVPWESFQAVADTAVAGDLPALAGTAGALAQDTVYGLGQVRASGVAYGLGELFSPLTGSSGQEWAGNTAVSMENAKNWFDRQVFEQFEPLKPGQKQTWGDTLGQMGSTVAHPLDAYSATREHIRKTTANRRAIRELTARTGDMAARMESAKGVPTVNMRAVLGAPPVKPGEWKSAFTKPWEKPGWKASLARPWNKTVQSSSPSNAPVTQE